MGVERVLQAARRLTITFAIVVVVGTPAAVRAAPRRDKVAVIDLGPNDPSIRRTLAAAVVAGGLDPVLGDGVEDALAGESTDRDALQYESALAEAKRTFGALDCKLAVPAAKLALGIQAARQAGGRTVSAAPAWTYLLLCADLAGDTHAAIHAAAGLRASHGTHDVPDTLLAKYPEIDTVLDREIVPVEIRADVAGAEIWIDFHRAGTSPLTTVLGAGEHVIAASAGGRRGWAAGVAIRSQPVIDIVTSEQAGTFGPLAARIASWKGALPSPTELAHVLDAVGARIALIRRGDRIEAWGRAGRSQPPRRLGGDDGSGDLADAKRLVGLIADRVQAWNDRAPDPDQPLLVEDPADVRTLPRRSDERKDEPTKWWVYATVFGALAAGAGVLIYSELREPTQRVELTFP